MGDQAPVELIHRGFNVHTRDKGTSNAARRGYGSANGNGIGDPVRYGIVDAELLRDTIDAVANSGDAIIFGLTKDGGAYSIRVLSDAGNGQFYPPSPEAFQNTLVHITGVAKGL